MISLEEITSSKITSFDEVLTICDNDGIFLEFGVHMGGTLRAIASTTSQQVYGFDSFEGLPETWNGLEKGHFACTMPIDLPENITLIKGWFEDTLPEFVSQHLGQKISFIHIDCDLYSSTKCVFDNLKFMISEKTIIAFDEIINYGAEDYWREHEFKAFNEFLEENKYICECIGQYSGHKAAFKVRK